MYLRPDTYGQLNVSGPCDLTGRSITNAQKCQAPRHKIHTDPAKKHTGPT